MRTERKCISPLARAVLKALLSLRFLGVLFLCSSPVFPGPYPLAASGSICGTGRAVERVVLGRGKCLSALPALSPTDSRRREQRRTQASVQREDGGTEPFADQRIRNALRTDTLLAVVQEQAVSAIVIAALMYQSPGSLILLIDHAGDLT